ncbi:MAG TPA: hypothetical protein VMY39_10540, partial [Planctomycetota bacterium]|nr:hypothetical protein [Planctomycetota bacterium]
MALLSCSDLPEIPDFTKLVFANGTTFDTALTSFQRFPNVLDLHLEMLQNRLLPAVAGLRPTLNVIDALAGILTCLNSVKDAISATPPDPTKMGACLSELQAVMNKVLETNPLYWVPICIIKFIDAVILILDA